MRSAQPSSQHTVSRWEQGERRSSAGRTCGPGGASWTWGRSAGQHPQGPGSVLHTPWAAGCCQPTLATAPLFSSSFFKWHPPRLRAPPAALRELAPPPRPQRCCDLLQDVAGLPLTSGVGVHDTSARSAPLSSVQSASRGQVFSRGCGVSADEETDHNRGRDGEVSTLRTHPV